MLKIKRQKATKIAKLVRAHMGDHVCNCPSQAVRFFSMESFSVEDTSGAAVPRYVSRRAKATS